MLSISTFVASDDNKKSCIMIKKPTLKIVLDNRNNAKADGKKPLALRVTYNRKTKFYLLGDRVTQEEWDKLQNQSVRGNLRNIKIGILEAEKKAYDILNHMSVFQFEEFKLLFTGEDGDSQSVYHSYTLYIQQ